MRGIRKHAVMLPLPRKSRFECAYFILKREAAMCTEDEDSPAGMEMLAEAGRILQDHGLMERSRREKDRRRLFWCRLFGGVMLFLSGLGGGLLCGFLLLR